MVQNHFLNISFRVDFMKPVIFTLIEINSFGLFYKGNFERLLFGVNLFKWWNLFICSNALIYHAQISIDYKRSIFVSGELLRMTYESLKKRESDHSLKFYKLLFHSQSLI